MSRQTSLAKQAQRRVRSTRNLALVLAVMAAGSYMLWGSRRALLILLGLAGFFAVITALEMLAASGSEDNE